MDVKRRKDCSFGLHFDFHAHPTENTPIIGVTLIEEDIRRICREIRPDFIQIDCKGHPGWASYPTKLGNAMPLFAKDTLKLWRRVTREEGVALFMHYSGVVDGHYCALHPKESVLDADGTRNKVNTRTFTKNYARDLLIPQLEELAGVYGVDGVWIDGECWGTTCDYDPETVAAFEQKNGINLNGKLPVKKDDYAYEEYRDFCRQLFRDYISFYVEAVHEKYPDFQIASNWAFSDYMPEKVCANVDFISGDFSPWNSINSARYAGRAIAQQNMPWDLMSWNFRAKIDCDTPYFAVKTPAQMIQEAASVISLGGGYQNYITQYPDGSPKMEQILRMKPVADMVRERSDYCFRGETVPQIAVLLSTHDRYLESENLFSRNGNEKIMGLVSLLCDNGHVNSIVSEHSLTDIGKWPVIIVPELYKELEAETAHKLMQYAKDGGSLLLAGANTCRFFEGFGAPVKCGEYTDELRLFTADGYEYTSVYGSIVLDNLNDFRLCETARSEEYGFGGIVEYGKGKISFIGADIGSAYCTHAQAGHGMLINKLLDELYTPIVSIEEAEGCVELNCLKKNGKLYIQLVNMNGDHTSNTRASYDRIQPSRNVKLRISLPANELKLLPENKNLAFTKENGFVYTVVDRIPYHEIIEVTL